MSITRNLIYLLAGRGVYLITRFIYVVILATVLGPSVYGIINYGIAWYLLFFPLTSMGMAVVLSRDVGKNRPEGGQTAALTLTIRILLIVLVTSVYLTLSFFMENDPSTRLLLFVFAFALIGRSMSAWTESVYTAYEINQYSFRQQSIFRTLEVIMGIAVLFIWKDPLPVVFMHGIVWCLEAVYGLKVVHRQVSPLRIIMNYKDLQRIFLQGVTLGMATLFMVFPSQGPLLFFRHLALANGSLGQLALAMQFFLIFSFIPMALGGVALPVLSRSMDKNKDKVRLFAETALRFTLLVGIVLIFMGTSFGPWLTVQIFGERYVEAGTLIGPVLFLIIPNAVNSAMIGILIAGRQDRRVLFCTFTGAVCFLFIITKAVGMFGAVGAIGSAGAAMLLTAIFLTFTVYRLTGFDLSASLMKPGIAVLSTAATFCILYYMCPKTAFPGAMIMLAIISYRLRCLTPRDMVLFRQLYTWLAGKFSFVK
jgi:O-antigen/teichoic acid export membrane protein